MGVRKAALKLLMVLLIVPLPTLRAEQISGGDMTGLFLEMPGWRKLGEPEFFDSTTLYKQIDGAAELFLQYGFEKLAVLSYEALVGYALNVEIYRHDSARNAFGIFARERPGRVEAVPIGGAGYYSKGVLNFNQGRFYVKLTAFGLGRADRPFLISVARGMSAHIPGSTTLPKLLECFPDSAKVENSEKYFPAYFLDHEFLRSAFSADYKLPGKEGEADRSFKLYIIEGKDSLEAREMLDQYLEWAKKKGSTVRKMGESYAFKDPDNAAGRNIKLEIRGKYIWGRVSDSSAFDGYFLREIEKNLASKELLN